MGTVGSRKRKLSVADFLGALEARLAVMKPAELRAGLLAHAERLPPPERGPFLAIFEGGATAGEADAEKRSRRGDKQETLLRDIDAAIELYEESRGGHRWNEGEEDPGDEDWGFDEPTGDAWPTAKIDALFRRADAAFRAGDLGLAREAYHKLLHAIAAYQEEGFDEGETAGPVEETDLSEAKARHLRALYETTHPEQRPGALLQSMKDLQYVGHEWLGLPDMIGARRTPLPDRERFLEAWIALLGQRQTDPDGFDVEVRRLLFQAVAIYRGSEGLAELARRDGRRIPEAYRKWILALAEDDKTDEAIQAAQEALRDLPPTGEIRAWVAEFLRRRPKSVRTARPGWIPAARHFALSRALRGSRPCARRRKPLGNWTALCEPRRLAYGRKWR
jgi:tetratricopeptide (TPR) repeat protein